MDGWEAPPPLGSCSFVPQQHQHQYQHQGFQGSALAWNAIYNNVPRSAFDIPMFSSFDSNVGSSGPMLHANHRFQHQPPNQQQSPLAPQPQPQPQTQTQTQPQTPGVGSGSGSGNGSAGLVKRPRGRPRKYAPPNGSQQLALVPANDAGQGSSGSPTSGRVQSPDEPPSKRPRGRPPGTGRRQQLDDQGKLVSHSAGTMPTPHILVSSVGEDITAKLQLFSQLVARPFCVLAVHGTLSSVTVCQASSGGVLTYEGLFDIISLSGSYKTPSDDGPQNQLLKLNICVSGPDGKIIAGGVGGPLIAASPVQLVLLSFKFVKKKLKNSCTPVDEHTTAAEESRGLEVTSRLPTENVASAISSSISDQH